MLKEIPVFRSKYINRNKGVILSACLAIMATGLQARNYKVEIVTEGLENPAGIMAGNRNILYYTEIPEPGIHGAGNTVKALNLRNGRTHLISEGEPYPINVAVDYRGNVYWSCQAAGVILKYNRREGKTVFLGDPTGTDPVIFKPTGITVDRHGDVLFTELIEPGIYGANMVSVSDGTNISNISDAEPAPTDIVIGRDGTAYWTCATAGVILKRSPAGVISLLKDGLNTPTGIDLDWRGRRLYFTEVPTPGIGGDEGDNTVNEIDLRTMERTVIATGFPHPQDVTVAHDGTVYWTCSKAGVIASARVERKRGWSRY